APALRLPTPSGRNLKNSAQNLVRMEPGKIATHYSDTKSKIQLGSKLAGETVVRDALGGGRGWLSGKPPCPLVSDSRTVLAVKGSLRRAHMGAPLTSPGRSELAC